MKLKVLSVEKSPLLFNGTWIETAKLASDDVIHGILTLHSHDHPKLNVGDTLHVEIEAAPVAEKVEELVAPAERRVAQRRVDGAPIPEMLGHAYVERAAADRRVPA